MTLILGDALEVLAGMEPDSVDAIVTDPPAGIGFMGMEFDSDKGGRDQWVAWLTEILRECYRVAKPGAHAFVWALPRTSGWTHRALEDAGWVVKDCCLHLFGSGFPKSLDVSKALDRAAGAEREVTGKRPTFYPDSDVWGVPNKNRPGSPDESLYEGGWRPNNLGGERDVTAPATDLARQWEGWGSSLKPAAEFWYLARKPLSEKSIAANVTRHGTGAINVDGCRIGTDSITQHGRKAKDGGGWGEHWHNDLEPGKQWTGRWPANVILDEDAAAELDEAVGERTSGSGIKGQRSQLNTYGRPTQDLTTYWQGDTGGPSRFFYTSKASRAERDAGLKCTCYNQAWANGDQQANIPRETATPRPRDTTASTTAVASAWPMSSSGSNTTDLSLTDSRFTTTTSTNRTTGSKTSGSSMPLHTSGFTADVSCETESGGSPVPSAAISSPLMPISGISAEKAGPSTGDAALATSESSSPTSKDDARCPNCGQLTRSIHPTVKPLSLMRWLCRLITPPGGLIVDPFLGSGSTGCAAVMEGFQFIGIEQEEDYLEIARRRIAYWQRQGRQLELEDPA